MRPLADLGEEVGCTKEENGVESPFEDRDFIGGYISIYAVGFDGDVVFEASELSPTVVVRFRVIGFL